MKGALFGISVLLVFACACAACVANEPAAPTRGMIVSGPPPAPVAETPHGNAPNAQSIWVAGYWHWAGAQYVWIPGHWDTPPPGRAWNGPEYTSRDGTYFYQPGNWAPAANGNGNAPARPANASTLR